MPTASPFNGRFSTSPGGMAGGREPSPFDDTPRKQVLTTPSPQAPVYHEQRSAEDIEAHRVYNDGSANFMGQSPDPSPDGVREREPALHLRPTPEHGPPRRRIRCVCRRQADVRRPAQILR
ncbi:hypothetical protein DIPPA_12360 [Diplonema papillatum]|nr:hypothetical protein DIPPA_12360 [Diplonema papillatum]